MQLDSVTTALKDAFGTLPFWKRFFLILWLLIVVPLYNLNMLLVTKLFNRERNKPLRKLDENIWVVGGNLYLFFKLYPSYMMVIKGKDGNVLLINPIEPQTHTLQQIQEIGPIKAIFVANHFHDTWISQWKDIFPEASFHTVKSMRGQIERSLNINSVIEEDADFSDNFGIAKLHDISVFMRPGIFDYMLSIHSESNKKVLVLPHSATTEGFSLKYFLGWILGYTGMGFSRINNLVYIKDIEGLKEYTLHVLNTLQPNILFAMHGKPIEREEYTARFICAIKKC